MSDPVDHHYLPIFYLNRWRGDDQRVCRFNRPHSEKFVAKRVFPRGTAYEEHLYSVRSPDGPPMADMERGFMSRMDADASQALGLLEIGLPEAEWERGPRSAWTRFLWALSIRAPAEITQLRSMVKEAWSDAIPDLQERYEQLRPSDAPERVDDYLANLDPYDEDSFALAIGRKCMDHSGIGQIINNMHWRVLDFDGCGISLLTSDRPVWMTATLSETDAFITLPIGPTRLFVASKGADTMRRIANQNRRQHAKNVNKLTVQHAVKFVFGTDDKMKAFVQKHFATKRHTTHLERVASMRGHQVVADESPANAQEK